MDEAVMSDTRILLIDDDQEVGRALGRLLTHRGYDVVLAGSGPEGLQKLSDGPWDLVLTDLFMPEVDGLEVTRAALRLDPVPAIRIMTGTPDSDLVDDAAKLMGSPPLAKPMSSDQLYAAVEAALASHKS